MSGAGEGRFEASTLRGLAIHHRSLCGAAEARGQKALGELSARLEEIERKMVATPATSCREWQAKAKVALARGSARHGFTGAGADLADQVLEWVAAKCVEEGGDAEA
jgi:hypothetical protein